MERDLMKSRFYEEIYIIYMQTFAYEAAKYRNLTL